jgi:carbon-monoxide dehydrogenase medium subunit
MRARSAEDILKGSKIDDALIEKAAQAASDQANPRSGSIRASAEYKKAMVKVFVKRAVKKALAG